MSKKALFLLLTAASLLGCTTPTGPAAPLVPNKSIQLTANTAISISKLAVAGLMAAVAHVVYDPLAPNWEIEESRLSDDTYRFSLKMKRFHTGGAGESIQIVKRRADQLLREEGYVSYQLLAYTEGIESETLGARRVANGTVRLVQRQQADSFQLNGKN